MPELPEVETIRRQLAPVLSGARVGESWAHPSAKFATATAATGAVLGELARRGKYLLAPLDDDRELVVHLGMTGSLAVVARTDEVDPYVRAWWDLDLDGASVVPDGVSGPAVRLRYRDVRRFGRTVVVARGSYEALPTLAALGPEPFDPAFDGDALWRATRRSRARIKTQLLGQRVVAGVGSIYADEALWEAGVHPARRAITRVQAHRLVPALQEALASSIERGGTTFRDYRDARGSEGENQRHLRVYGRAGEPCVRCGTELRRRVWDGRSATFCPTCQPR
ncbi:MAG: bifunctional DNA-formamidopyrimidine glycosylase/DNA-(apurinic or apyrimidinic site) lyase [Actinomycetota bacterium]|nr:bifunctional DNA-formamidopyrimidine glycosylase/DNA-(apurinic or apyrimidinic site) lyase [Actinomycetota bacterium]